MRSVVASHGPGSNPRGPNQPLEEIRPAVTTSPETRRSGGRSATATQNSRDQKRARHRVAVRKLHGLPGTDPNQNLEEIRPAVTTSPETRRSGGRSATATQNSRNGGSERAIHAATARHGRPAAAHDGDTSAHLARDERSNAARPTHGQRATYRPSSRKGAAQNQRTIGQPPPRNISPKQQPSASHRTRTSRDNRASARAHALEKEAPPRTTTARRPNQNFDFPILNIKRLDTIWKLVFIRSENHGSDTTVGDPDHAPRRGSGRTEKHVRETINTINNTQYDIHRVFKTLPCWQLVPGSDRFRKENGTSW
ncbi:hypothetical protein F511_35214 [Dorcoceras hygrometricum]|uniref:Uncharacterized protein n=1 Tax=Dorcoceras hygrometricum TaxID=472368 RepID=A0A2Z7AKQ5_9LAMI|nr:hypothetical protein F511_35214 [Dorcoceras hygrometricum]